MRKRRALREAVGVRPKLLPGPVGDPLYEAARAVLQGKAFEVVRPCGCSPCSRDGQHEPFCRAHDGGACDCVLADRN